MLYTFVEKLYCTKSTAVFTIIFLNLPIVYYGMAEERKKFGDRLRKNLMGQIWKRDTVPPIKKGK